MSADEKFVGLLMLGETLTNLESLNATARYVAAGSGVPLTTIVMLSTLYLPSLYSQEATEDAKTTICCHHNLKRTGD